MSLITKRKREAEKPKTTATRKAVKPKIEVVKPPKKKLKQQKVSYEVFVIGDGLEVDVTLPKGLEADDDQAHLNPWRIETLSGIEVNSISAGAVHALLVSTDKQLYSWGINDDCAVGHNWSPKLENPENDDNNFVVKTSTGIVSAFKNVQGEIIEDVEIVQACAGDQHSIALDSHGRVFTWGTYKDASGKLIYSDGVEKQPWPQQVVELEGKEIVQVVAGKSFDLSLDSDGHVFEWGFSLETTGADKLIPRPIFGFDGKVKAIFAGFDTRWAITEQDHVFVWGLVSSGQGALTDDERKDSGSGVSRDHLSAPCFVSSLSGKGLKKISTGSRHSLALDESNNLWTWGMNELGQIGLPENKDSRGHKFAPEIHAQFQGNVLDIVTGEQHSVVIKIDGSVWGFGSCSGYQLGYLPDNQGDRLWEVFNPVRLFSNSTAHLNWTAYALAADSAFTLIAMKDIQ
jgi:regulator of chromosome condensation